MVILSENIAEEIEKCIACTIKVYCVFQLSQMHTQTHGLHIRAFEREFNVVSLKHICTVLFCFCKMLSSGAQSPFTIEYQALVIIFEC